MTATLSRFHPLKSAIYNAIGMGRK